MSPFIRSPFNYDRAKASEASGLAIAADESVTQQQFKDDADINVIVKRFGLTGEMPQFNRMPQSGDFTDVSDFHSAMNLVRQAQQGFMEFPAAIRSEFSNDPGRMLAFLSDPDNRDKAVQMGLVNKAPVKERTVLDAIDELSKNLTEGKASVQGVKPG